MRFRAEPAASPTTDEYRISELIAQYEQLRNSGELRALERLEPAAGELFPALAGLVRCADALRVVLERDAPGNPPTRRLR